MRIRSARHAVVAVVVALAVAACETPSQPGGTPAGTASAIPGAKGTGNAPVTVELGTAGTPYNPTWLDDALYFGVEPKNDNDKHQLWRWREGHAERVPLKLPADCYGSLLRPVRRPGGALAVVAGCYENGVLRFRVLAVDRSTGATEQLFRSGRAPGYVTWSGDTAFASVVTGGCAAVTRLRADALEAIDAGPTFAGRPWPSSGWAAGGATTCPGGERVVFPTTLDRTDSVAALATGDAGATAAWTLFLAPAGLTGAAKEVAGGFVDQAGVAATPDGSRFVVAATRQSAAGLWLVDAAGGTVHAIAPGAHSGAAIAPDGGRAASVQGGRMVVYPV
ncbi:hypothetical protein [Dactylosporangium sp. NPDC051484]|uniref:TolB family protein n=1 Tax=Dactylosporangium sp. NPDC051484 TaxID=3154942 RepID=UPI00344DAC52